MDMQEHRMQCLRMAFDLKGDHEAVLSAAEKLHAFVAGPQATTAAVETAAAVAHEPVVETVTAPTPEAHEDSQPVATIADPIAACGTAMTMAPSGDLADAVPVAENHAPVEEHVHQPEPALEPEASAEPEVAALDPHEHEASPTLEVSHPDPAPSEEITVHTAEAANHDTPADETPPALEAHAIVEETHATAHDAAPSLEHDEPTPHVHATDVPSEAETAETTIEPTPAPHDTEHVIHTEAIPDTHHQTAHA